MLRSVLAFSAVAAFLAAVAGCAVNRFERREPWRDQAENMCISRGLVQPTAWVSLGQEIAGPGPCGLQQPFKVTRLGGGSVIMKQRLTIGCPALAEAEAWLADTIQPAARLYFGVQVAEINAGTYACRGRNNRVGAKLSEHSFGNALDIMSFTLADGHVITIKGGWRGTEAEQGFLREVFTGACNRFNTVLGPGSDMFHYDHFHVDLARHDPRGMRRVCKPRLAFASQLGAGGAAQAQAGYVQPAQAYATPRPAERPFAAQPSGIDEEQDPYGVGVGAPSGARSGGRLPDPSLAAAPRPRASADDQPQAGGEATLGPPEEGGEPIY